LAAYGTFSGNDVGYEKLLKGSASKTVLKIDVNQQNLLLHQQKAL